MEEVTHILVSRKQNDRVRVLGHDMPFHSICSVTYFLQLEPATWFLPLLSNDIKL